MNCICCAISAKDETYTENVLPLIKNAYVSLFSAKYYNPDVDCILITNIKNLPDQYRNLYIEAGIQVRYVEFNKFVFADETPWKFAYYKLCALSNIVDLGNHDKIILVDVDTVFVRPIDQLIDDCDDIMLYCCSYPLSHQDRRVFLDEIDNFFHDNRKLLYYGGEFIAGPLEKLRLYLVECENVYEALQKKHVYSVRGDEFIWSYAAANLKIKGGAMLILIGYGQGEFMKRRISHGDMMCVYCIYQAKSKQGCIGFMNL